MFSRANPAMTSLPCSCKDIYAQNATEELLHEDECCDLYGRSHYSNILYENNKEHASEDLTDTVEVSKIFTLLKLNPSPKTDIHELREISPWRTCESLRDLHKGCAFNSENVSMSEKGTEKDQIRRRSLSTSEATVNQNRNTKSENSYEAARGYSDSKLAEDSRKGNYVPKISRFVSGKGAPLDDGYKFYHFKDFWKYMREYVNNVTIVTLQQHYRNEISRRHGNQRARCERRQSERMLKGCEQDKGLGTTLGCEPTKPLALDVPATNHDTASRDKSCDQTRYSFKFPTFETCSFKVARCHVYTESQRRETKPRSTNQNQESSSVINQKIQLLCQRLSNANYNTRELDKKARRPNSTKILQKSKTRKLEIVTRPSNKSPRKHPSLARSKTRPPQWQNYSSLGIRFPSPRIICKSPTGKQANFQGKIIAKKYPTIKIPKDYPLHLSKTKKVFLQYGSKAVHGRSEVILGETEKGKCE